MAVQRDRARSRRPSRAPGELEVFRSFLNTGGAREELGSVEQLESWLAARQLLPAGLELTAKSRRRALAVRDGLRAVLALPRGARPDPRLVTELGQTLGGLRFELLLDAAGRPRFEPVADQGLDAPIATLMAIAARCVESWPRFKVCGACDRFFYDASSRRNAKWCSKRCGDRVRARKYRRSDKFRKRHTRGRWQPE